MFYIWGGNLDSLSFYDGGPAACLEGYESLEEAKAALTEWHKNNYAAWIQDENGKVVS